MQQENNNIRQGGTMAGIKRSVLKMGPIFGTLLALIVLILILTVVNDRFFTATNMTNVVRQASTLAIAAVGTTMIIISQGLDLSIGSIISFNNVLLAMLIVDYGINTLLAILLVLVSGIIMGIINGFFVNYVRIPAMIVTLATMISYGGLAYVISRGYGVNLLRTNPLIELGNGAIGPIPISALLVVVLYALMALMLRRTRFGRIIYGLGGNEEMVFLSGISVKKLRVVTYGISGFLAAVSAVVLTGRVAGGHPAGGQGMEMDAIAATVLGGTAITGGVGSVWGTLIGVFIMMVITNGLTLLNVNSYTQIVAKGLIILAAISVSTLRSSGKK